MSWSRSKGKKYNWLDIHALFYTCNKLVAFNVHHRFRDYHKLLLFQSSNSRLLTVPYFFLGASESSAYRCGQPSIFSYVPRRPGTFEIKITIHNTSAWSQWSYGKIVYLTLKQKLYIKTESLFETHVISLELMWKITATLKNNIIVLVLTVHLFHQWYLAPMQCSPNQLSLWLPWWSFTSCLGMDTR